MRIALLLVLLFSLPFAATAAEPGPLPGTEEDAGEMRDQPDGPAFMRYAARLPVERPKGKTYPLIIALHGIRGNERSILYYIALGLQRNGWLKDAIVLGLKSKGDGWSDDDHESITKAAKWAMARWPIDPRRVYGYGLSHGAMRLGIYAPRNQDLLAAVAVMSGNVQNLPAATGTDDQDLRFYVMHGDADEVVGIDQGRAAVRSLTDAHYRLVYRELTGEKHIYGREATYRVHPDAIRWLFAQRLRMAPANPAETAALAAAATLARTGKGDPDAALRPLTALAGEETDETLAAVLGAKEAKVRAAGARLCGERLYGPPVEKALQGLVTDPDAAVRKAAIIALGFAAQWRDAGAIEALTKVVEDPKHKERLGAAGQLAAAWRMQVGCTERDAGLEKTLGTLSTDKLPALAELARSGLAGRILRQGDQVVAEKPAAGK